MAASTRRDIERWFVRRGVPHFIEGYSATEDVLTRALPVLVLAFLFSAVNAIDVDWPAWGIALAIAGGLAVLFAAWGLINRLRGRVPLAPPDRIGGVEVGVFLFVPALLPVIFGGDWSGVALSIGGQAMILGLVYAATSYGLAAVTIWAGRQLFRSLAQTFRLFTRGLPLLLLGFMFLFINAEAWQSAGTLHPRLLVAAIVLFSGLAAVFLATQVPREVAHIGAFHSWDEVGELVDGTPVAALVRSAASTDGAGLDSAPPLSWREWGNLGLVVVVTQALRILLVSVLIGGFFVVLGLLVIQPATIELWTADQPTTVWRQFTWFGVPIRLTTELIQVSAFLAAFAGVYFSVYSTTDPAFRSEFFDDTVAEVRQAVAVRGVYLAAIPAPPS